MNQYENYGKKQYQFVDVLFLEAENTELLRIAGDNEMGLVQNSEGVPILPGTSVAGAVQDYLNERKSAAYNTFWGNEKFDNKVYFFDCPLIGEERDWTRYIEKRTGHKHDAVHGGAEDRKLFTNYYLKSGCRFYLVIKVFSEREEQAAVKNFFQDVINGIQNGGILFGSQKNIGFGKLTLHQMKSAKFDFGNKMDLYPYYLFHPWNPMEPYYKDFSYQEEAAVQKGVRFIFHGKIQDALLVQAENKKEEAGYQVIQSMKKKEGYFIPGSTWKGILRGYCEKILKTLEASEQLNEITEFMFGTKKDRNEKEATVMMGKVRVRDTIIQQAETMEYTRIKIDRFTGGTISGAKMASEPVISGMFHLEVELSLSHFREDDREKKVKPSIALLYFALRDLALGKIPVGSFASVGFGRLKGTGMEVLVPADFNNGTEIGEEIHFESTISFPDPVKVYLTECIRKLKEVLPDETN